MRFLLLVLLYSSVGFGALRDDGVRQSTESFRARAVQAVSRGATFVRVWLIASDSEMPLIRDAIDEAEHAVEPPTNVEGFWRRRWETLRTLRASLDLRRSFQNVRRLIHLSQHFENPWLRNQLINSAIMFGFTHGGEFISGSIFGTKHLLMGDLAGAFAWYGLAIPGLYDVGCWFGQGALLLRPTREGFNSIRQTLVWVGGEAATSLRLKDFLEVILETELGRDRLIDSMKSQQGLVEIEIEISNEKLAELLVRKHEQNPLARLQFLEKDDGSLVLQKGYFDTLQLSEVPYGDLHESLSGLGWNVMGALRQIQKLIRRNESHLIAHERTFTTNVEIDNNRLSVEFRHEAVTIPNRSRLKFLRRCSETYRTL